MTHDRIFFCPKYPGGPGAGPRSDGRRSFFAQQPLGADLHRRAWRSSPWPSPSLSEAYGVGFISTSFVKTLGKTLCLCLVALAMDLIWGYAGILSLGHMAFFALGGYMIGMWLMYARTEEIVVAALAQGGLPATPEEMHQGIATQIFGVVGVVRPARDLGLCPQLPLQLMLVAGGARPSGAGLRLAGLPVSRVTGRLPVDPDAGDDAGAGAVPLPERLAACAATTGFRACRTCPALAIPRRTWCRSGSSGPRRWRLGWAIWPWPGSCRASSGRSSAPSAMTRRGCGSLATRSRATSCSSSP